MVTDLIKWH